MAYRNLLLAATFSSLIAGPATAATYSISLTGQTANFSSYTADYNHEHHDGRFYPLSGLDSSNAVTVSQGDTINTTVTFDNLFTVPASMLYTNFLLYYFGSSFPHEDTGVTGTFTFYNGATQVASYGYGSTTSSQLSSYAALFPPNNGPLSFTSFTNNFIIDTLATPATLDNSALSYELVSGASAVPEPAAWAMMIAGFGIAGAAMRRQKVRKLSLRYA